MFALHNSKLFREKMLFPLFKVARIALKTCEFGALDGTPLEQSAEICLLHSYDIVGREVGISRALGKLRQGFG